MRKNAKILALANSKGGVGKTSLTFGIAGELAHKGYDVLIIDIDPQASQTKLWLDVEDVSDIGETHLVTRVFRKEIPDPVKIDIGKYEPIEGSIWMVPSHRELQEVAESGKIGKERMLAYIISKSDWRERFDWILIDPPSNTGSLMAATLLASDYILIPQQLSAMDETGTEEQLSAVAEFADVQGKELSIIGIVPTFFKANSTNQKERMAKVRKILKPLVEEVDLNFLEEDIFLPPIRDKQVWKNAVDFDADTDKGIRYARYKGMTLREYILKRERNNKDVLTELRSLVNRIEKLTQLELESVS